MWSLRQASFAELPGWEGDDHGLALQAFARHSLKPDNETYRTGKIGIKPEWFDPLVDRARTNEAKSDPCRFFASNFDVFCLSNSDGKRGSVTGFYEPVVEARRNRDEKFSVPLLNRPSDLIAINDQNRPAEMNASFRFGRQTSGGMVREYHDRAAINAGAINDEELAIAWVEDPVDAFFVHIQGAAALRLSDGEVIRITYDSKNGHPFTSIGKLLVERHEIPAAEISMQTIRQWLGANPASALSLMEENRSYIFFKESTVSELMTGPIAAAKVPLTPERSLAVDRLLHTFSTPVYVCADKVNGNNFNRLMIAQETGSAIVGPSRGDIFFGTGDKAGELAGTVNSACDFYVLIPKGVPFDANKAVLP